ncbi:MAG: phasin family protein [Candidatus Aquicultor sp.]
MSDGITDIIRRTLLVGIGAASLTADRAQELVNDLVERGEITRDQAKTMVRDLMSRGTEARNQLRDMIKAEVRKAIDEADIPTKTDIRRLEHKIDRLALLEEEEQLPVDIEEEGEGPL